jgi:peptide/nickel transport system permease protein
VGSIPLSTNPIPVESVAGAPRALSGPTVAPLGGDVSSSGGLTVQVIRVFIENRLAVVGLLGIIFMVLFCFIGPIFYHTNQTNAQTALLYSTQNASPSAAHLLGTDNNGFDMVGRLMYSGQVSLEVGFVAAAIATGLGVLWGATAGFLGGWVDALMMRFVDILLSIPTYYLVIVLAVIFQPSLTLLMVVLGFVAWESPARLIRGETLTLRVREYVQAVKVMGGSKRRVVLRHIVPNTIGTIMVNATFQIADAILLLAALGFIGLGVPAPLSDWGSMLSNGVSYAEAGYWWEIYPAGVCIVFVVVAFNFIGDALRDSFEVRLQKR